MFVSDEEYMIVLIVEERYSLQLQIKTLQGQ